MKSGVLNLKKEAGFTSHDAVAKLRRLYGTKKVGHTGTLDPQAEGVLPVLIGSAVKACDLLPSERKVYRATLSFGLATDTEDIWGKVIQTDPARPDRERMERAVAHFVGSYDQIPPMVSAVKINGKKLYEYAREGKTIERPSRRVTVYRLELLSFTPDAATLLAEVSAGTYIRTLLVDLCREMGCLGVMDSLVREEACGFSLADSYTLSQLEAMSPEQREALLLPTESLFSVYPVYSLPPFFDDLIANGQRVLTRKLSLTFPVGARLRLYRKGVFFALGEITERDGERYLGIKKHFPPESAE